MSSRLTFARRICDLALEAAEQGSVAAAVVVCDLGGHIVAAARMDGCSFVALEAARRKALAAGSLRATTADLASMFKDDSVAQAAVLATGDFLLVPGGFPLEVDGTSIGGLGVAGGHHSQDHQIGHATMESIQIRK